MRSSEVYGESDAVQPPASHPLSPKVEEAKISGGEEGQRETKIKPRNVGMVSEYARDGSTDHANLYCEANVQTSIEEREIRRANTFILAPTRAQETELRRRATSCAKLWNEVNYQRRQAYSNYHPIDWNTRLYKKYVHSVGSATAQEIRQKNSEAWRSFLALKRLERRGQLPPHI